MADDATIQGGPASSGTALSPFKEGGTVTDFPAPPAADKEFAETLLPELTKPTLPPGEVPTCEGYELLDLLGHGGMGVVYRAQHKELKRQVAIKMVLGGQHASAQQLSRFRTEAEAVARLQHPNIVQIYEIGQC